MSPKHPRSCFIRNNGLHINERYTNAVHPLALWRRGSREIGYCKIHCAALHRVRYPIARFFFLRNDSTRNTIKPVVATLVHQLIRYIPDLKSIIVSKIQSDPLIFTKSLASQFDCLIFGPLQQLQPDLFPVKLIVLLIDGLDECDGDENQVNLIAIITKFVTANSFPLIFLFCSRAETQIKTQFRSPHVAGVTHLLPLDDNYLPDRDIHLFLDDNFATIKTTHTFNHLLDVDWPSSLLVDEIVTKSSGQFIYASVVVKFVSDPRSNPYEQLEIVRGLRPSGNLTPFAQLDGLYRHIFSRVQNISRATQILVHVMLSNEPKYWDLRALAWYHQG